MKRRQFTAEFKAGAVRQTLRPEVSKTRIAQELQFHGNVLRKLGTASAGCGGIIACNQGRWVGGKSCQGEPAIAEGAGAREDGARHSKKGDGVLREEVRVRY